MKKAFRFSTPFIPAFLLLGLIFFLAGASNPVEAAPAPSTIGSAIVVTTLDDEHNDDGDCSLREAISAANSNDPVDACPAGNSVETDIITFAVKGTIALTSQLDITAGGPMTIFGGGVITISGENKVGVFYVHTGVVTLNGLTILNGHSPAGFGGIRNDGVLTVTHSLVSNNIADNNGGGILNSGTLTVTHSIISGNTAVANGGGGIDNWKRDEINVPRLYVAYSTLSGNTAASGGGVHNWLGIATISNSTLSGNTGVDSGGGIANWQEMTIINSTISSNHTEGSGGGIFYWGITLAITNSTITGNDATDGAGGGINNGSGVPVAVSNTIIAYSPSGGNCSGNPVGTESHNIEDADTCGFDPINGSLPNTNPTLGPLQANGGPTRTHALLEGSPAIDAGDNGQCPPTDQRGFPRPIDGNGNGLAVCDVGAYEYGYHVIYTYIPIIGR